MRTGDREGSYAKMAWNQHKDATARRLDNSQGNSFLWKSCFFTGKSCAEEIQLIPQYQLTSILLFSTTYGLRFSSF